jgi:endonuclease YncB( thermonuclease family)
MHLTLLRCLLVSLLAGGQAVGWAAAQSCPLTGHYETVRVKKVYDGDTLQLYDGRRVRIQGINAPEVPYDTQPGQPYGQAAKKAATGFLPKDRSVRLYTSGNKDRYGRVLGSVAHHDGRRLATHLLARGLAWQVVIPPPVGGWRCLQQVESRARHGRQGIWSSQAAVRPAEQVRQSGFQLIRGRVIRVTPTRKNIWIDVQGELVIRVPASAMDEFEPQWHASLEGKSLEARGWIIDRARGSKVLKSGYQRWMLSVYHPQALIVLAENADR